MIFVAVGTTRFDGLIQEMDRLAPSLPDPVVMQIGSGQYVPMNGQHFRYAPSLDPYYEKASIVVSHGGLGIVTEALLRAKKLVAVDNPSLYGGHQSDLLGRFSQDGYLIWCHDPSQLSEALERARQHEFPKYVAPGCEIHNRIRDFLRHAS